MFVQTRDFIRYISIYLLLLIQSAFAQVHAQAQPNIESWKEVGRAELSVLWFDVYDAVFYTPNGAFDNFSSPLQLSLDYKRDISREDLLSETDKQFARFQVAKETRLIWLTQLENIWPDIKKGDQLIFQISTTGKADFFHNKLWIGGIEDMQFSEAFIQIWLSDQGEYPELARKLKGQ